MNTSTEFLIRTAFDKAAIYQMRAADSLQETDLAHAKAYAALGNELRNQVLKSEDLQQQLDNQGGMMELRRLRIEELEKQNDELLAAIKSFGHKPGCRKNAFGDECSCGVDSVIARAQGNEA